MFPICEYYLGLHSIKRPLQDVEEAAASGTEEGEINSEGNKAEVKAVEGGKGIWGRFKFKKRQTNEAENTSNSPTIKAGHSKAEKEGEHAQ